MKLPRPGDAASVEAFRLIEMADNQNYKRDRDLEIGQNRIILTSPNGSRYALTVTNAGVLGTAPV